MRDDMFNNSCRMVRDWSFWPKGFYVFLEAATKCFNKRVGSVTEGKRNEHSIPNLPQAAVESVLAGALAVGLDYFLAPKRMKC